MIVTEAEAHNILASDAAAFRKQALHLVKVELNQHQFDALASFIHNVGPSAFAGSTLLKRLNVKDFAGAAEAMLWWNKPPEIIPRRQGEYDQFTEGRYIARRS
jgi:lysozyme